MHTTFGDLADLHPARLRSAAPVERGVEDFDDHVTAHGRAQGLAQPARGAEITRLEVNAKPLLHSRPIRRLLEQRAKHVAMGECQHPEDERQLDGDVGGDQRRHRAGMRSPLRTARAEPSG
ncbi:MAG: hypothetical protein R3A78_01855 [Polyangiales bacterium]